MTTLVVMADTHGYHDKLVVPEGDILIHAGDMTQIGTLDQLAEFTAFLKNLSHRHKIVVAGNHDFCVEQTPDEARALLKDVTYLQDEAVTFEGITFYGSPWQPRFFDWAFNVTRGEPIAEKWRLIPDDTDVLITHGPPRGFGDNAPFGGPVGCEDLLRRVREIRPRYHLFGHIHQDRGMWREGDVTFVNATTDECMAEVTIIEW